MMDKKLLILLLAVFAVASYENTYAHGGGGSDRSYTFDKSDNTIDQEARKKAAEKQAASENWGDFMTAIKEQETKPDAGKDSGQSNPASQ